MLIGNWAVVLVTGSRVVPEVTATDGSIVPSETALKVESKDPSALRRTSFTVPSTPAPTERTRPSDRTSVTKKPPVRIIVTALLAPRSTEAKEDSVEVKPVSREPLAFSRRRASPLSPFSTACAEMNPWKRRTLPPGDSARLAEPSE